MDAVSFAAALIDIPSPSHVSNVEVVGELERAILAALAPTELERIEYVDENGERKVCLVLQAGAGEGGMVFYSHTDTVPAREYRATLKDGRLYGRGACDMKGPIACVLEALASRAGELKRPVYWVLTADEEIGFAGAEQVVRRSALFQKAARQRLPGVITEPTELTIVHGHKGCIVIRAVARGVAAHSSTGKGVNANLAMIPFLQELKRIHDELISDPRWRDDRFDPPVPGWNIVVSDGGTPPNVTAPLSVAQVSWRPLPGQDTSEIVQRLHEVARRCGVELEIRGLEHGPLYVPRDDPVVRTVAGAVRELFEPRFGLVSYGTDGTVFGRFAPAVVFGPGSIEQAHREEEWITLEQMTLGVAAYTRLIEHICCN